MITRNHPLDSLKTHILFSDGAAPRFAHAPQWLGSDRSNRFRCVDFAGGFWGYSIVINDTHDVDDSHIAIQLPARRYATKIFARRRTKSSFRATRGSPIQLGGGCNSCVRAHPVRMAFGVGTGRAGALGAVRFPGLAYTRGRCPSRKDPSARTARPGRPALQGRRGTNRRTRVEELRPQWVMVHDVARRLYRRRTANRRSRRRRGERLTTNGSSPPHSVALFRGLREP